MASRGGQEYRQSQSNTMSDRWVRVRRLAAQLGLGPMRVNAITDRLAAGHLLTKAAAGDADALAIAWALPYAEKNKAELTAAERAALTARLGRPLGDEAVAEAVAEAERLSAPAARKAGGKAGRAPTPAPAARKAGGKEERLLDSWQTPPVSAARKKTPAAAARKFVGLQKAPIELGATEVRFMLGAIERLGGRARARVVLQTLLALLEEE